MTPEEIAVRFEHDRNEIDSLKHRMDECEEQQTILNKLVNSVDVLAVNMKHMADEQKKQGDKLEKLEHEPTEEFKHYKRLIIGCVVTTVLGAVIGAVLATIM